MRILRGLSLLVLLLCLFPLAYGEKVSTLPKPTGYVDDYAGAFSADAESQMESLCKEVHDKTKAQIFVVTINTLDNSSVEQFSNDLFHTWKIGEKKTDRGVLVLFAVKDHKYRIEVGYGLEGILNDAKVGDIGREMVPHLKASDYDDAAKTAATKIATIIAADSNTTIAASDAMMVGPEGATDHTAPPQTDALPPQPVEPQKDNGTRYFWFFFLSVWGVVITIIAVAFLVGRRNGFRSSGTAFSSSDDDSSSSSSSSDSSSSSSDSFSGGDGGDSGGGGASGSW